MLSLSLLLSDGATVLPGHHSQGELHDQFSDGRGCYYLHLSALDTAVSTTSIQALSCRVKELRKLVTKRWST
eukprot:4349128-Amphidinium_carterae.1